MYEEPKRTPPFLDLVAATPSPSQLIIRYRNGNSLIRFDVPFRSEDNEEDLFYALYVDYGFRDRRIAEQGRLPPGTFDDTDRAIRFDWDPAPTLTEPGCYQLTLLLAHTSSWGDFRAQQPDPLASIGDIAMATWWLGLDPSPAAPETLVGCPNTSEIQP